MHIYEWQSKYNVGIEAIDIEHRNLLTCINKLIAAQSLDKSIVLKLADEVIMYAQFHFISEENLMHLTNYPKLSTHSEYHKILLEKLTVKRDNIVRCKDGLMRYVDFLIKWFIVHTQTIDRELAKYLAEYEAKPDSPEHIIKLLSTGESKVKGSKPL